MLKIVFFKRESEREREREGGGGWEYYLMTHSYFERLINRNKNWSREHRTNAFINKSKYNVAT